MEDTQIIGTIIQGGAVGISIMLIFFGWKMFKVWIEFVQTALKNNTDATNKLVDVIEKLVDKIEAWGSK